MKGFSGEWKKKVFVQSAKHADVVTTMQVVFWGLDIEIVEI